MPMLNASVATHYIAKKLAETVDAGVSKQDFTGWKSKADPDTPGGMLHYIRIGETLLVTAYMPDEKSGKLTLQGFYCYDERSPIIGIINKSLIDDKDGQSRLCLTYEETPVCMLIYSITESEYVIHD